MLQLPSIFSSEVLHLPPLQTSEHTSLCQHTVDLVFPWIPLSFQSSLRYPKPQLLSATLATISSLQSLRLVLFALFPRSLWFCFEQPLSYVEISLLLSCTHAHSPPRRQAAFFASYTAFTLSWWVCGIKQALHLSPGE